LKDDDNVVVHSAAEEMAEGWATDKVLKEAFVSGLAGGTLHEISALTAVGLVLPPPPPG